MQRVGRVLVAIVLGFSLRAVPAGAQVACSIAPEFEALVLALGTERFGACTEQAWTGVGITELDVGGQHVKVADGALGQLTTTALLVRDAGDGTVHFFGTDATWAARTADGQMQRRTVPGVEPASAPSVQRPPAPPVAPPTRASADDTRPRSKLTPALSIRCSNLGNDLIEESAPMVGAVAVDAGRATTQQCRRAGEEHGAIGVECFEAAHRRMMRLVGQMPPGSSDLAGDAMQAEHKLCVADATR